MTANVLAFAAAPLHRGESITVRTATDADAAPWNAFVTAHPDGTVDHLWQWRAIFTGVFGHQSRYLIASAGTTVVGVLPLVCFRSRLFGRFVTSLPFLNYGGMLTVDDAATRQLLDAARRIGEEFGASHVELRHATPRIPELPNRQHKLTLKRSLPDSTDALWTTLDKKVRNQVRKAQKDGLTAAIGGEDLLDPFYAVFSRNMRDLGTPVYPKALFHEVLRQFPVEARVHLVSKDGVPIAGSVTLRHKDTVLVPWASALRDYRQHCPNMLLYWSMLEQACVTGARVFDFGRSSPDGGTHHFKVQWGAEGAPQCWEYLVLQGALPGETGPQNPRFAAAIAAWQRLPLWLTNAVGPAIVRNIP